MVMAALGSLLTGCQQAPEKREPTPLDLGTVGTIAGVVRFEGTPPMQTELNLSSSADCAAQHQGPVLAGDVLVTAGAVENAIVYLEKGLGERVFAAPETTVVIDQKKCLFVPRVAAAQVGQTVRFLNSDKLAHNVHGLPRAASGWNFMLGVQGASRETAIDASEPAIEIKCDVHPWMKAYLGVFDHPYFAVTGGDGRFELAQVPPGEYTLAVWHERLGSATTQVTLAPQGSADVTLTLPGKEG
jgi:plastocyanin